MLSEATLDPVEPDALEPFLPRLREAVPGLRAVPDDGEAPGRAAQQQHLPLGVRQLLRLVDDDVRERAGEQVRVGFGECGHIDESVSDALLAKLGDHALVVVALEELVDDPVHPLTFRGDGRLVTTPAS